MSVSKFQLYRPVFNEEIGQAIRMAAQDKAYDAECKNSESLAEDWDSFYSAQIDLSVKWDGYVLVNQLV